MRTGQGRHFDSTDSQHKQYGHIDPVHAGLPGAITEPLVAMRRLAARALPPEAPSVNFHCDFAETGVDL
jgi:hypothetical protein